MSLKALEFKDLFPSKFAAVLERQARALAIPVEGVVSLLLQVACIYSPSSFTVSSDGGQLEPTIGYFLQVAF
jgi:hypothetical protein